jgi:hypothetical protein
MSGLSITTLSASVARRSGIAPMKRRCSMRTMAALCLCAASSVFGVACSSDDPTGDGLPTGIHRFSWDEVAQKPRGPLPHFSFFVTTQRGLFGLGAGRWAPAPDPVLGYGGDLGGIAGADEICSRLAQKANPGDSKVWHAFLSTSGAFGGPRQNAIDRIGSGPWYDFEGRKLSDDVAGLMPVDDLEGRPRGADQQLAAMFTGENGERIRENVDVDNHDVLTGSDRSGRLYDDGEGGIIATCEDWTSKSRQGRSGGPTATGGQVPVGHSWPRSNSEGRHWISEHTVNGCEPGVDVNGGTAAPRGDYRVGAAGGYGGFYCFALNAIPPEVP